MRFSVRWLHVCAGKEKRTLRKSAFCAGTLTERRILDQRRHGKAHSGCALPLDAIRLSRKSAPCMPPLCVSPCRTLRTTTLRVTIARVTAPRATALDIVATELRRTTSDYEACWGIATDVSIRRKLDTYGFIGL